MREVGVILLAAGGSTRLGRPKQLLKPPGADETLLRHATRCAVESSASFTLVVLGADADACRRELTGLPVTTVENPAWRDGMASSLRTGLTFLLTRNPETEAVVVVLCDQPFLTIAVMDGLIRCFQETRRTLVGSEYADGTTGVPALFAASRFKDLLNLRGDQGARKLLRRGEPDVRFMPFPRGGMDIDTPEDQEHVFEAIKMNNTSQDALTL